MDDRVYLSIKEVQKIIPYSVTKIKELLHDGKIIGATPNGKDTKPIWISRKSLEKYMKKIEVHPDEWTAPKLAKSKRRIISKGRNGK